MKNKWARWGFNLFAALWGCVIFFSRIYVRVHWFTDVLGGMAPGLALACLLLMATNASGRANHALHGAPE